MPPAPRRKRIRTLNIKDEDIVERVLTFFRDDDINRTAEKEARIQRYAKYRMWVEGKDWPYEDASDVPLADIMEKSLRMEDTLHNAVMSSRPVIGAKATEKNDAGKERTIDRLIDFQIFVEQNGEDAIGDMAQAFVVDGSYKVFIPWVKERREISDARTFDPIPEDTLPVDYFTAIIAREFPAAQAFPTGDGWDWQIIGPKETLDLGFYTRPDGTVEMIHEKEVVVYDGPRIIQKEWDEVLYPVQAANLQIPGPSNPHGAAHVIVVDYPTVDEIRRLAKDGTYDRVKKEDLDQLEVVAGATENKEMRDQKDALQGVLSEADKAKKTPEHRRLTRLMCFDLYDIDKDDRAEDVIWWVLLETKTLLRAKRLTEVFPSNPPKRPIIHRSMIPVRDRVEGISLPETMEGLHDVMKTIMDQTVDAGTFKNAPFWFYRPSGSMKPEIIRLSPGEGYPLQDPQRDVFFPNLGNQDQTFGINMLTMLTQMEDRLTTIGPLQLGSVPQGKASALRTVGGMALIAGQGEARPERILRRFFSGLAEIWAWVHQLNRHFLPERKKIRIMGIKEIVDDPYQEISRKNIDGRYEFDFKANVLNTSKMALQESIDAIMGAYVSELAIQLGIIDGEGIYKLFREFGFSRGQDPDQYLKPPTPTSLRRKIFAEEAIANILDYEIPDGVPAEPGGAMEHMQKLAAFAGSEQFGLFDDNQTKMFAVYLQQVQELAAQQQQQMAVLQAAAGFGGQGQQGGGGGRPPETIQQPGGNPPVGNGELLDESLPGARGMGS